MNISLAENLPGLVSFNASQQNVFYGRQRQVEDLLSIMQSSRFIGLVGHAGSGKSSLIKAGLIPALERGFDGIAGKKWTIAYCRTGITPLENLAGALAEEYVLVGKEKGSLELRQEIVREMRKDHSGLLRSVAQREILKERNLLIILDQFEDIFQFEDVSKARNEQWDQDISLFFHNLVRAVSATKAPIYLMIGLRSSFLPKLYNLRGIQEYLNAGLYAIPLLRQDDLKQIIQRSLKQNGITIKEDAHAFLEKGYNQNAQNLPFVQLSIHRLVQNRLESFKQFIQQNGNELDVALRFPEEIADYKHVASSGDITLGVANDLETFYLEQAEHVQLLMQKLFKMITRPGFILDIRQARTVKEIRETTDVQRKELNNFLIKIHKKVPTVLDFIQPYTHNTEYFHEDNMGDDTIINLRNDYLVHPWRRLKEWIKEELESRETYSRLTKTALLFQKGEAGYLIPPDLDVIYHWFLRENPKKVWADQFNSSFHISIDFLKKSKEEHQLALEKKELERKKEIKSIKKNIFWVTIIAIGCFFVGVFAYVQKINADKEQKKAEIALEGEKNQTEQAKKARIAAVNSAKNAETEKEKAKKSEKLALSLKEEADSAKAKAIADKNFINTLYNAIDDKNKALKISEKKSTDKTIEAIKNKEDADKNAAIANNTRDFIDSRSRIVTLLNRLNSESFLSPESKMSFIDSLINNYDNYFSSSLKLPSGKVPPFNELYSVLTSVYRKIFENKSPLDNSDRNLFKTESGLRDIDIYDAKVAVAAGDDHKIVFFKPGAKSEIFNTKINNGRIRSIKFINETKVVFSNLDGELYLFDKTGKIPVERKIKTLNDKIISSIIIFNNQLVTLNNGNLFRLTIETEDMLPMKAPTGLLQLFELPDKRLILKTVSQLFIYDLKTETATPIALPTNISALKISSVAMTSKYSFWGTDAGELFICNPLSNKKLSLLGKLKPHKTKITSLLIDNESQQLITASMDNTSKIYAISSDDFEDWEQTVLSLEGFKKWIWDLGLIKSGGRTELVTVDEGGELLRWSTRIEDIYKDVKNWKNKNK